VKQESLFYWCKENKENPRFFIAEGYQEEDLRWCSAFTMAELGKLLSKRNTVTLITRDGSIEFWEQETRHLELLNDTEADARARCLIYLLENGLMDTNEIKEKTI
jgi:hypothetical protein